MQILGHTLSPRATRIAAGVALAALVVGIVVNVALPAKKAGNGRAKAIPVVAVDATAQEYPLILSGVGTIQAFNTVDIRAQLTGTIQKIAFDEGQTVHAGDLLAQVDPRPYQAALTQAEAALARDKATLANVERDLKRYESLSEKGFASAQQLETQRATVMQASSVVKSDEAAISNARTNLSYTSITAPIDGITGLRNIDVGNIIQSGAPTPLVSITQIEPIAAIFTLPSAHVATVRTQMLKGTLTATVLDQNDKTVLDEGRLEVMDNQVDQKTGTIKLKAVFPNKDHKLWPGAFINVDLKVETRHNGVTVPSRAIQHGIDNLFVYVVKPDQTAEVRPVTIIDTRDELVLIGTGLKAGEKVVIDGQVRLSNGAAVSLLQDTTSQRTAPDA